MAPARVATLNVANNGEDAAKKTRGRRRKRAWYFTTPRQVRKPGFDAFNVKHIKSNGEEIIEREVFAPESGIHSLAWAQSIASQPSCGFLKLPIEVRHSIYALLFEGAVVENPRKCGVKFSTGRELSDTIVQYNTLSVLSRQTYVDIVGGSLLYYYATFSFTSPTAMAKYLDVINPAHRAVISKVDVTTRLNVATPLPPKKLFTTLSSLPNLHALSLNMQVCSSSLCAILPVSTSGTSNHGPIPVHVWRVRYMCLHRSFISELEMLKHWDELKGIRLETFEMRFTAKELQQNIYGGWNARFKTDAVPHLACEERIREMVLGKEEI